MYDVTADQKMTKCKLRLGGLSAELCGYSTSGQCNIFIGCKPHGRTSHTGRKPTTLKRAPSVAAAQPVENLPHNLKVMGSSPPWVSILSHICARFGMCGRHGIILSRFWLRGQLQYRTALVQLNEIRKSSS